ncbi:membrane associated rhomboid family serine protease [Mucilaginibacter frigoritolerans]|jgi:membrane associated rhomboid family serine protease|uniref:Membrane associated rhomboid family serine protease n=2 Tax=Mucilaginibacter frigoritolerans TaxID=652788 RepID=A0A562U0W5_9SPHI|nr:rhomboid family intramembrane serine protease [Mucilaginibacter frigoritolerans]TWI99437.1 membrane associated rhomboid family serine protease [Mucilaginibacter frigoritolerans]
MMEYLMMAPVASFIFAITILTSVMAFSNDNLYANLILHPYSVSRRHRVYTVITSGLIHNDWMHLFFNMLSFYFFAFRLEPLLGHWQFGLLYVVSLILSDLPTVYKHRNDDWYHSLGASGAVSAVIFSAILFNPLDRMMIMPIPIGIPAVIFGVLYLVYCNYASKYSRDNINHDAHMFGALSGLLITIILQPHVVHSFIEQVTAGVQSLTH